MALRKRSLSGCSRRPRTLAHERIVTTLLSSDRRLDFSHRFDEKLGAFEFGRQPLPVIRKIQEGVAPRNARRLRREPPAIHRMLSALFGVSRHVGLLRTHTPATESIPEMGVGFNRRVGA